MARLLGNLAVVGLSHVKGHPITTAVIGRSQTETARASGVSKGLDIQTGRRYHTEGLAVFEPK